MQYKIAVHLLICDWKSETSSKYMQSIYCMYTVRINSLLYTCSPIGWRVSRDYLQQDVLHTEYGVSYIKVSL